MSPTPLFPRRLEGLKGMSWMAKVELDHVVRLASTKTRMLEIGTASGVSAGYVSRKNPNLEIVCVDTFEVGPDYDQERFSNWKYNATDKMQLINGHSSTLHERLSPDSVKFDLILIDGDHSYEGCLRDLKMVVPYCVIQSTSILCHDYGDPNHAGVQQAVQEFLQIFPQFKIVGLKHSLVQLDYLGD